MEQFLQELAAQLGTTTEYLWEVLMKQTRIVLIQNIILIIISIGYLMFALKIHKILFEKKIQRDKDKSFIDENFWLIPIALHWVIVFGLVACTLANIVEIITVIYNPEYWALKEIFGVVK